jgi:serine/threonine protein kinase
MSSSAVETPIPTAIPLEIKKGAELRSRYVFSDFLGAGGFATVWRATDKQESRDVAIKRLLRKGLSGPTGEELKRFLEEARATATLRGHKNIVEVFEAFEESGDGFIIMEYVDGKSLDALLRECVLKKTWLPVDEALDYFKQLLEGLVFAHSCGVYHRDIKPSNIIVSKLGVVKLVDFGLAKPMPFSSQAAVGLPHAEHGFAGTGTPAFMSYEQARGDQLDHHTDIFSAAMVGYLLLTGRHPFNHPSGVFNIVELIRDPAFVCDQLPNLPGVNIRVIQAITRMLAKDRSQRCHSLLEPLTELTKESAQLCSRCGTENRISNKFCGECGRSLTEIAGRISSSIETNFDRAEALTDEGFELTKVGSWKGAIAKYRQAVQCDPTYGRAYTNLGFALNRLGNYSESIEVLTKGIDTAGNDRALLHRLLDNRGFSKSNLKDFTGAIEDFDRAIELNSTNPRVIYHRAEARAEIGDTEAAYLDVLRSLELDPDFFPAQRLRLRLENGKFGSGS